MKSSQEAGSTFDDLESGGEHVHLRQALEVIRAELLDVVVIAQGAGFTGEVHGEGERQLGEQQVLLRGVVQHLW